MKMQKKRKIPKTPDEVLQKRTPPVVKLVARPASFRATCDYLEPIPSTDLQYAQNDLPPAEYFSTNVLSSISHIFS
jgi:hypothetical protein